MTETDDQAYRIPCLELRGGNERATFSAELPGLACWISCNPLRPSRRGGDLYFLSACSYGVTARVVLADVSGHGEIVSAAADHLREVLRHHIDDWDQSMLVRHLNDTFLRDEQRTRSATALLASFASGSGELLFTNAGHPPPLWYRAATAEWSFLHESTPVRKEIADLPLGLIDGTPYHQTALQLQPDDVLILYTDGISEAEDESGEQLGQDGILSIARGLPIHSVTAVGLELLAGVARFRRNAPAQDDATVVALTRVVAA